MGRKNHSWDPVLATFETDGTLTSRCRHCGLEQRHGWYRIDGTVYNVMQWYSPRRVLLGRRHLPGLDGPAEAPTLPKRLKAVPVRGVPECPKTPDAWKSIRSHADCW